MTLLAHVSHDGGRAAAGFRGPADDCVVRAIAIATGLDYRRVYKDLYQRARADRSYLLELQDRYFDRAAQRLSPRLGVPREIYEPYLTDLGWVWTPTMQIGEGCTVHLRADELPDGWLLCRLSKHLTAVRSGVIYDTHDPTRDGTRCVYGYYTPSRDATQSVRVSASALPA